MDELTDEILEIDQSFPTYNPKRSSLSSTLNHPQLLGTTKRDFRIYSSRVCYLYSSFYSNRRDFSYKKSKLTRWI